MGEAKRKRAVREKWFAELDEDERTVVLVAERLHQVFPLEGACYHLSLFLRYYLEKRYGIIVAAVIGFVNDGTDELYSSHAWVLFRDKITDLALSRPLNAEIQKPGPLIIHGREVKPGWRGWTYHEKRPPEGNRAIKDLLSDPGVAPAIRELEKRHLHMMATAKSSSLIREYLDGADESLNYDLMVARL